MIAPLLSASWNRLVEGLKRLEALRECVETSPERGMIPFSPKPSQKRCKPL
jgi:hypothetical protein